MNRELEGVQPRVLPSCINFPPELPVSESREQIRDAIRDHQVVVIAGETGSGKTTQLPKICLELGRGSVGRIGHTQPRRLAARTVAQRIADELQVSLGDLVGYKVRFNDSVAPATAVKLMTDGILLTEMQRDRDLREYDTLIIDEAHERSLNIDFILGYLKKLLPRRPDLKVIITSATIDLRRFSAHFGDAPIIEVTGRSYPVEVHYLGGGEETEERLEDQVVRAVDAISAEEFGPRGDVLVFLPGEREIRELSRQLKGDDRRQILPLYARLTAGEQNKVFRPSGGAMRVVLATNVAETSLTVPGIRYVVDPGTARISRYSPRNQLQRLPIERVSQASADQRKGRCGRVAAGVCLRLYDEQDFASRPAFTDPEILRTNLAAVVLRMLELGLGDIHQFPFIDPPEGKMIRDGYRLLEELGAVSARGKLTSVGRKMARLPVDPKLARMLLAAIELHCLEATLVIVSAMAVQDPRERPAEKRAQADQAHARFNHPRSDFIAWVNLWRYVEGQRQALSQNQLRKLCKQEYLSFIRLREWREVHAQLVIACRQMGLKPRPQLPEDDDFEGIHKALLSGLLAQVAQQDEGRAFNATRNRKVQVFPGSALHKKPPKWLVAGEMVETSQVFARQCAAIDPHWLLRINPKVLKLHHYEPAWHIRSGRVMAKERVTLYGLTVSDGRLIHFGEAHPGEAREIFIREALVAGEYRSPPEFLRTNLSRIADVQELESRTRRRDLLVDEQALFAFYDERIGKDCLSAGTLEKWLRRHRDESFLHLSREQILTRDPGEEVEAQFPSTLKWQGDAFPLVYQFEPGRDNDGVSVTVPLPLLNRAPRYLFEWLVPGLLRDKCIALVKSLPKSHRKQLVPVPDVVDELLAHIVPGDVPLSATLSAALREHRRVQIPETAWDPASLEPLYRMNIRVVDEQGKLLAQGREMADLVGQFRGSSAAHRSAPEEDSPAKERVTRWDFGELPSEWRSKAAGMDIVRYPALVDHEDRVAVELLDYPGDAARLHPTGVAALACTASSQTVKYLRKHLFADNDAALVLAGAKLGRAPVARDVILAAVKDLWPGDWPRDEAEFARLLTTLRGEWVSAAQHRAQVLVNFLRPIAKAQGHIAALSPMEYRDSKQDIQQHLEGLLRPGIISATPLVWFEQFPRYGKAIQHRVERLSGQYPKDRKGLDMLQPALSRLGEAGERYPHLAEVSPPAEHYRWMLEEFRVSLFAQQLGTRAPVSVKRLDQQWQLVTAWITDNPR